MPACTLCGVNMTTAEVTQRPYDGFVGNYHKDCAYMDYLFNSGPVNTITMWTTEVTFIRDKLRRKHMQQALPPAAPSGVLAASTNLGIGAYQYAVTFVDSLGESTPGAIFNITTTTGNQAVNLSSIPLGPSPLTTARKVYRTVVAGSQLKLLTTISDNVTTTFNDSTADGSLGVNAPTVSLYAQEAYP